jgi:hypothetical protein
MASTSTGELFIDPGEWIATLDGTTRPEELSSFDKALPILLLSLTRALKTAKRSMRLSDAFSELETIKVHPAKKKVPSSVGLDDYSDVEDEDEGRGWEWCCRGESMSGESIFGDTLHDRLLAQQDELECARIFPTLACLNKSACLACKHFDAEADVQRSTSQWSSAEEREMKGVRSSTLLSLSLQLLRTGLLKKASGEQICDLNDALGTTAILASTVIPTKEDLKMMYESDDDEVDDSDGDSDGEGDEEGSDEAPVKPKKVHAQGSRTRRSAHTHVIHALRSSCASHGRRFLTNRSSRSACSGRVMMLRSASAANAARLLLPGGLSWR